MRKLFVVFAVLIVGTVLNAQDKIILKGYVKDFETGEALIGAYVIDSLNDNGTITNEYGYFIRDFPKDASYVKFSYVGYNSKTISIENLIDTIITIRLKAQNNIEEITIRSSYDRVNATYSGVETLNAKTIKNLPVIFGEPDITRILTLMPGVSFGSESTAGYMVRGGSPDQNLLLIDGAPVYNPYHLFGFYSVFNTDAINNMKLYKGSLPASIGGRLSSALDIQMKEGNANKISGKVKLGLQTSKILLQGPIWKGKTSFLISFRRSMFDLYQSWLIDNIAYYSGVYQASKTLNLSDYTFYDLNAKVNHTFSSSDRIYLNFYKSKDNYTESDYTLARLHNTDWGNIASSLRWNHIYSNRLFSNLTLYLSNYSYTMKKEVNYKEQNSDRADIRTYYSQITDIAGKMDFDYAINNHKLKFGIHYVNQLTKPSVSTIVRSPEMPEKNIDTLINYGLRTNLGVLYLEDSYKLSPNLFLNVGIRATGYLTKKKFYPSVEPRLSLNYRLFENFSLKAAYTRSVQHIHLLSDNWSGAPTDIWVPSTNTIRPEIANQLSIGYVWGIKDVLTFEGEAFAKNMKHLIEYKEGASYKNDHTSWEDKVEDGKGYAYGYELSLRTELSRITGLLAYTWSKSMRSFENINQGKEFPYIYDRPHNISIALTYQLGKKYTLGTSWVYASGHPMTLSENLIYNHLPITNGYRYYSSVNNYRIPNYHRLDLSLNYLKSYKRVNFSWNLGIYNVYNRQNTYYISDGIEGLTNVTLFGIQPYFNLSFEF